MKALYEAGAAIILIICVLFAGFLWGSHHTELKQLKQQQALTAERDKLQTKLDKQDIELQTAQATAAAARATVITKKEVVYRDKIKNVDTRKCVIDSGVLDLYDATVSTSIK